jgi:hypothetical protein
MSVVSVVVVVEMTVNRLRYRTNRPKEVNLEIEARAEPAERSRGDIEPGK